MHGCVFHICMYAYMNSATVNHLVVSYYFVYKTFILPAPLSFWVCVTDM